MAKQQGLYAADLIRARIGGKSRPTLRYRQFGNMATIGGKVAVVDFGRITMSGRIAWLLWGFVHVRFLIGFRSRLAVLLVWLWAYVTFQRGSRLVTGATETM